MNVSLWFSLTPLCLLLLWFAIDGRLYKHHLAKLAANCPRAQRYVKPLPKLPPYIDWLSGPWLTDPRQNMDPQTMAMRQAEMIRQYQPKP